MLPPATCHLYAPPRWLCSALLAISDGMDLLGVIAANAMLTAISMSQCNGLPVDASRFSFLVLTSGL